MKQEKNNNIEDFNALIAHQAEVIARLEARVASLENLVLELRQENAQLREENALLKQRYDALHVKYDQLAHQHQQLLRHRYGKKSERMKRQPLQEKETSTNSPLPRQSFKGKLPAHLKRERIEYDISLEEKYCAFCQGSLHRMGEAISEQLELIPASLYIKQHVRLKYACRCGQSLKIAPLPDFPIEKSFASASLLAEILINKYEDALPLYRQAKRFARVGIDLACTTLGDWVNQCGKLLAPLVGFMRNDVLLKANKIHSDDTPWPILAPEKTHTGRLWVYRSEGKDIPACTLYDYTKTRSQTGPAHFLQRYQGYLQADAYSGYHALYHQENIIEVACWAHVRRRFYQITLEVQAPSLAHEAMQFIQKLYAIERHIHTWDDTKRRYYRRYHAKPLLRKFKRWLNHHQPHTLPKSPLGQAIAYALNHWQALQNYLREGFLNIDNNAAERAIKPLVIGRKNYLFSGSHPAAQNAAVIYSLIETCKQHGINTFDYLKDVLTRLPTQLMRNIGELAPYRWQPQAP